MLGTTNTAMNFNCFPLFDFSFLELILSTFFGFASALLVEAIIGKHKEKAIRKQLLNDLYSELTALKDSVQLLDAEKVYIQPYSISIWIGARECGTLLCMDKQPYFPKILEIYSSIEEANLIELKCFELCIGKSLSNDMEQIKETLADNRQHIKKQIEIGITLLDKEK